MTPSWASRASSIASVVAHGPMPPPGEGCLGELDGLARDRRRRRLPGEAPADSPRPGPRRLEPPSHALGRRSEMADRRRQDPPRDDALIACRVVDYRAPTRAGVWVE